VCGTHRTSTMDGNFAMLSEAALNEDSAESTFDASAFLKHHECTSFLPFHVLVREPDFPATFLMNLFRPRPNEDFTQQEMRALEGRARHLYDFARKNAVRSSLWPPPDAFVERHRQVAHAGWRSMAALIEESIGPPSCAQGLSM
jgi:hypothetical protein